MNSEIVKLNLKIEELSSKIEAVSTKLLEFTFLQQAVNSDSSSHSAQPSPCADPVPQSVTPPARILSSSSDVSIASIEEFFPNPPQDSPDNPDNNLNSVDLTTQPY